VSDLEDTIRRIAREEAERVLAAGRAAAPANDAEWITVEAYAARRSISETTVRAAVKARRLEAMKFGRALRVRADVEIGTPARAAAAGDDHVTRARRKLGVTGR
jgi:hypothetical protein